MGAAALVYSSAEHKSVEQAHMYVQTHQAPHRYLAYRDIPKFIKEFVKGRKSLDYGSGTGASSSFLYNLGLDITGVDVSVNMLEKARVSFPYIQFFNVDNLIPFEDFDLVFSSFVLFELSSKDNIVEYLNKACSFLKDEGIFIGITGSEHLYSVYRNWATFEANFKENHNLRSGDIAKLALKDPAMDFYDYYWKDADYLDCFEKSGLQILQVHHPLGFSEDSYKWKDELQYSPFTVFIAKKIKSVK